MGARAHRVRSGRISRRSGRKRAHCVRRFRTARLRARPLKAASAPPVCVGPAVAAYALLLCAIQDSHLVWYYRPIRACDAMSGTRIAYAVLTFAYGAARVHGQRQLHTVSGRDASVYRVRSSIGSTRTPRRPTPLSASASARFAYGATERST
eukprot:3941269-Rhodomonas_salina.2